MKSNRDDFAARTKDLLAKRVGYRCSNPACRKLTCGANDDAQDFTNIGVAAHITAAANGGPRYDASLMPNERKGYNNGIWLCQNCAKLIDSDELHYPVSLLHKWKQLAEENTIIELATSFPAQTTHLDKTVARNLKEVYLVQLNAFFPIARYKQIFYFQKENMNSICKIADSICEKCEQTYILYLVGGKLHKLFLNVAYTEQYDFNNVEGFKLEGSILFLICEKKLLKYDLLIESTLKEIKLKSFTYLIKILIEKDLYVVTNKLIYVIDVNTLCVLKIYSIEDISKQYLKKNVEYVIIIDAVINCNELILSIANLNAKVDDGKILICVDSGAKENYIFSFDLTTEKVIPFMQKNGTARFMNTSNTRIGEDGHNYLLLRNKRLVSYYDNFVYIWDLHNKLLINTIDISIHKFGIEALAVYDNYIITGGFSSELKVWDYESKRCLYTFLDHSSQITDLKLIGCHLFSASSDNLIIKWDIKSIIQSEAFTPNVSRAKWDNKIVFWNSCKICANFESGYLELLDANSCLIRNLFYIGQQQKSITFCLYEDILYFDIFAFIDCKNSILVKYDLNTNISKKVQHESLFSNMLCFNDILLLSGWLDGKMTIKNGELDTLAIKTFHEGGILNVSQNDYFIATIAMDNKVRLWNKKDFSLFEEFDGWGAVYLCNKFLIFSTLKNELKFYLYNEILKSFEHNKSVNTNQKNIKEIIEYKELILTYDENSIIFWNHQLNRLSSKIFDMKIVDIILKDDILTIDHGLYKDKEIFKLEYLYS